MGWRGPGALPQVEKREQYARLIAQGYNNSEACRIVGINRRTGKRWRHGRTITTRDGRKLHYAAVVAAAAGRRVREISDRYLSEQERVRIADLRQAGHGVRAIAEQTGPQPVDDQPGTAPEPGSGQRPVPPVHRAQAGRAAAGPAAAGQDRRGSGAAAVRGRAAGEAVEPAAGQPGAAPRVPGRAGAACRARDDLPGGLPARAGRAVPGAAGPGAAHAAGGGAGRTAGRASAARTGSPP